MSELPDFAPEDLEEELEQFIEDDEVMPMLRHPLVYCIPYDPLFNKMLNAQLYQKQERLAEAEESGDWHTFVWLHERPYRLDAFLEILDQVPADKYWPLLANIWIDSENIPQNRERWDVLLAGGDPDFQHLIMNESEREALAAMPDEFTIYQGHTLDRDDGWSWTTEERTALWFARRFSRFEDATPVVTVATVRRDDVLAYFTGRNENEILVHPDEVTAVRFYAPGETDE